MRRDGASIHGKFMLLSVLPDAAPGDARVGIVTSRRVGGAVERNRVRRRLREIVRAERGRLLPGAWFVIIARHRAVDAAFAELREEWLRLVRRAGAFALEP